MSESAVNLDALIPREDFDCVSEQPTRRLDPSPIKAGSLATGEALYALLRKPDFQRETAIWTPEKVRDLVVAFVAEDLVPALILWRSPSNLLFVIDGAHRLSSLIAWVNDDYGDGNISRAFFGPDIPDAQRKAAAKAKQLIEKEVGPYHKIAAAFRDPKASDKEKQTAAQLNYVSIMVQGLEGGSEKAERSFFKINEQGVSLDKTELTLLHSRRCPNSVAARAVHHRGTGYPHWGQFPETEKMEIEKLAKEIAHILFDPPLSSNVLRTAEVPIAGKERAAGALSLLLNTVNLANRLGDSFVPKNREEAEKKMPPDENGTQTVLLLKNTKKLLARLSSGDTGSLELHPFVYFYSDGGRHLPSSYLAVIEFFNRLEVEDRFKQFAFVRERFECFLVSEREYIPQHVRKARGEIKAVHLLAEYFRFCFEEFLKTGSDNKSVSGAVQKKYPYLMPSAFDSPDYGTNISTESKSRLVINHSLATALRCSICHARIPSSGISFDHILDKKFGGRGEDSNIAATHTYCNNSKDQLLQYFASFKGRKND